MKEQLISLETAKLAKRKGFGDTVDTIALPERPTQSSLKKWLREEYNLFIQSKQLPYADTEFVIVDEKGNKLSTPTIYMYYDGKLGGLEKELIKALKLIKY